MSTSARTVLAAALTLGLAAPVAAQISGGISGGADGAGYATGLEEGRQEGRVEGLRLGRDQVLVREFVVAFRDALRKAPPDVAERYRQVARDRAREDADGAGARAGRAAGREAALAGRAVPPPPPSPEPPGLPPDLDTCRPPPPLELELPSGRSVVLELGRMPDAGVGLGFEIPEPDMPSHAVLRGRAALDDGYSDGRDKQAWADWYVRGFEDAFREAYHDMREGASSENRETWAVQGRLAGTLESERRAACEVLATTWDAAWQESWADGWRAAARETHAAVTAGRESGPLVALADARLVGEDADGLLGPDEAVFLVGTLVNHGRDAPETTAGRVRIVRGIEGTAPALGDVPASEAPRSVELALGRIVADAPVGSSVVVLVELAGGERLPVTDKVARPAALTDATARLDAVGGALMARIAATVAAVAPSEGLAVVTEPAHGRADVAPLAAADEATVELVVPADAGLLAQDGSPVLALRLVGPDGAEWDSRPAPVALDVADLVPLVAGLADPEPVVEHLWAVLRDAVSNAEGADDPDETGPVLVAYAGALSKLDARSRATLDERLTGPLLVHVEQSSSRRVRKAVRALLDS